MMLMLIKHSDKYDFKQTINHSDHESLEAVRSQLMADDAGAQKRLNTTAAAFLSVFSFYLQTFRTVAIITAELKASINYDLKVKICLTLCPQSSS